MATKKSSPRKTRRRPPDPAGRRRYDPKFVAAAVIACRNNGCDVGRTAAELKVPRETLRGWVQGLRRSDLLNLRDAEKDDMTAAFRDVAWAALGEAVGKVGQATFAQLMTGAGIAFDKMRLSQGQSTIVTETRVVSVDVARLAERMSDEQLTSVVAALESAFGSDRPGGLVGGGPGDAGEATLRPVLGPDVPGDGEEPDPEVRE